MRYRREETRVRIIFPLFLFFVAGGVTGWYLRGWSPLRPAPVVVKGDSGHDDAPPTVSAEPPPPTIRAARPDTGDVVADLRQRHLRVPIEGADVTAFKGQFAQRREGGARGHEAIDLLAPRNTPVYAVDDGTIAKLFLSKAGGNTIYQFDDEGRACYYYAHLERYADGLQQGQIVHAGDLLGFVGTSGNAPPNTPHLHFAVFVLTPEKQWWKGEPIDPFLIYGAR